MQVSQSMNVFPSFQLSQDFSLQETFRFHAGNQKKIRENISEIEKTQIIKFTELEIKGPIRHLSPDVFKVNYYPWFIFYYIILSVSLVNKPWIFSYIFNKGILLVYRPTPFLVYF